MGILQRLIQRRARQRSFRNQIHLILITLGIAPYLLVIYTFSQEHLSISQTILLVAVAVLLFHLLGFHMLRKFSDQLLRLVQDTETMGASKQRRIGKSGDYSVTELSNLTLHFNMLLNQLEEHKKQQNEVTIQLMQCARRDIQRYQKQLAAVEALRPYVNSSVVEQIRKQGPKGSLENQKRLVTILFADIRGFTTLSEQQDADVIIPMLNEYFDSMVRVIHAHHGIVDKFIGDAVMAVFGLTKPKERSTLDAVRAALAMRQAADELIARRQRLGLPAFSIGIGLNTGEVIAGNIGSENRKDYTVIGDTVNVAARLQSLAKDNQIVASEETRRRCYNDILMEYIGTEKLKNRHMPVTCYRVIEQVPHHVPGKPALGQERVRIELPGNAEELPQSNP